MAKSNKAAVATETAETAVETPALTHVEYAGFKVEIASIAQSGLEYLLQYGFGKSIQDSVAGRKKELAAETKNTGTESEPVLVPAHTEAEIAAIINKEMGDRVERIVSGTIGTRAPGAPRATPFESMVTRVAKEFLRSAAAAKKMVLPKADAVNEAGENKLEKLLSGFLAANRERIEGEAKRRLEAPADDIVLDL